MPRTSHRRRSHAAGAAGDAAASTHRVCLVVAVLIVALCVVYGQTRRFAFVNVDDDAYIYANDAVRQGITRDNLRSLFTRPHANLWHPLTTLSHLIDVEFFGLWAGGHHLTSVGLHILATLLIFRAFTLMTGSWRRSAVLAAVFGLHPLRVESVAWVCERKDVLSGVMLGWLLIVYTRYVREPSVRGYLAVVGVLLLGMMSKPTFVTVPLVLLLLDFWPLRGFGSLGEAETLALRRRRLVEKLPLLAIAAGACWITIVMQQSAIQSLREIGLRARFLNAVVSYVVYLGQFFFPYRLTAFYPHRGDDIAAWEVAAAGALLAAITLICFGLRTRRPYGIVGWLWYLGMLVPMSGVLQAGTQAHADRFTYLPHIGLALIVVWGAADFAASRGWSRGWKSAAAVIVGLVLAIASRRQVATWTDGLTLFTRVVALTEKNALGHNNLAVALDLAGRPDEALEHARTATELDPDYSSAWANYADLLRRLGRHEEALAAFRRARTRSGEHRHAEQLGRVALPSRPDGRSGAAL